MAVALSMHIPQGAEVSTEEDDLDLRWLEDRLTWAGRLGDAAQSLRDCESDAEFSDGFEIWLSLEETAKLRCEKRREAMKLEKLEKRMHLVSSSCVEAQSHLASLKRERDLLKDCVQELLVLAQPGRSAEVAARRQRSPEMPVAKGVAASLAPPSVAQTPQGATPRSARSGAGVATPNVLTVRRRVRFDDKLMESPREPRVPLPAGQVWQHVPILKHRPTEPVTQEPTSLDAQDSGSPRRSPSPPTARIEGEAPQVMDSARIASGEPMVRQAQESPGGLQLPRWAQASPPAAPQLIHMAPQVGRLQPMTGVVQPLQPWLIRTQPSPGMPQGPAGRGYGGPPPNVPIRRVVQRS